VSQDRTGQLWELYSYGSDGWLCLIIGPPLEEVGRNWFTLHPMICLQVPSVIDDPKEHIPLSSEGKLVLEEDEGKPWENDGCMERIG